MVAVMRIGRQDVTQDCLDRLGWKVVVVIASTVTGRKHDPRV